MKKTRPEYPQELFEGIVEKLPSKQNYLDIATGTGKILMNFFTKFQRSLGIDISPSMLAIAQKSISKENTKTDFSVELKLNNIFDLDSDTENQKYDLITVGQALHFFPSALAQIRRMLKRNGMFIVFGYMQRQVRSQNPDENNYYYELQNRWKDYITYDVNELHNHYIDYPFQKYFSKIQRKQIKISVNVSREEHLQQMKTWTGYKNYLRETGKDPLFDLEKRCARNLVCNYDYFRIVCYP